MQFIDLAAQYRHLKNRIDSRIEKVLSHGQYIMGPEVFELECLLADYVGVKHCISCANGTDALSLALMAIGCKEGDAVFCPSFTFFATAETVAYQNATPVFVDSDSKLFNICPRHLEVQIQKVIKTGRLLPKAIIAVDLFGLPANYPEIEALASKYKLALIEDAAQGLGGEIRGKKAGSFGDIAATSFFPAKPLGCYGDGGALFTNNDHYAELLKSLRVHGKGSDKYDNIRIGMNSRLDTIQAAILIEKLAEFPSELRARDMHAEKYNEQFDGLFETPQVPEGYSSSWAQYTLKADNRDIVMSDFAAEGIPTAIYYKNCLHQQIAFKYLDNPNGSKFDIAGIFNDKKNILGMMPHPERMVDNLISNTDGVNLFSSLLK
mgnify:CR=1 FL=1